MKSPIAQSSVYNEALNYRRDEWLPSNRVYGFWVVTTGPPDHDDSLLPCYGLTDYILGQEAVARVTK